MLTSSHLDRAVSLAIISSEQASALRKLGRDEQADSEDGFNSAEIDFSVASEDEPFRLIKGFRDFFIAIGIIILAIGLSMLAENPFVLVFDNKTDWQKSQLSSWVATATMLGLVIVAIGISEWVTRSQRLPLSSLVLTLVFSFWSGLLGATAFYTVLMEFGLGINDVKAAIPFVGVFGSILALIFYYNRYRLPFVLLPLAAAGVFAAVLVFGESYDFENNSQAMRLITGICGVIILVIAMLFDMKDRFWTTRFSECAFWLHLLAAPLIVHSMLIDAIDGKLGTITILLAVAVLAAFALVIDRRAMLVSALIYLGYSLFAIIKDISFIGQNNNSVAMVVLGMLVLGLGLGWSQVRRFLVSHLIWNSLRQKLPPVID